MTQKTDLWTIKAALDWTQAYLERNGDENPRLSAQWLLSGATGLSRIELYTSYEKPLDPGERAVLRMSIPRRIAGEPLQYIVGETGFRHLTIKVREGVLIPRPETEVLVDEALTYLKHLSKGKTNEELLVADICTGSGCIACAIAAENLSTRVVATDIAGEAIMLARENAEHCGLEERIEIYQGDLGEAVPGNYQGCFDLIVSNPPYIPSKVLDDIPCEVSDFEPRLALDGGEDGLDIFRRIVVWAYDALIPGGAFIVELHEDCLDKAADFARAKGFSSTRIIADLSGRPRILFAMV